MVRYFRHRLHDVPTRPQQTAQSCIINTTTFQGRHKVEKKIYPKFSGVIITP